MAVYKRKGRRRKSRAGRILSGLVIEGLGFAVCLWLLLSVWQANGGDLRFLLGGQNTQQPTPSYSDVPLEIESDVSRLSFRQNSSNNGAESVPIWDSRQQAMVRLNESGWNRLRIQP